MLYVDKGRVEVGADEKTHTLEEGDMIFHKPMEFHSIRALGGKAPNLFVVSFQAKGEGMAFYEGLLSKADETERHCISHIILESRKAFASPLNVPAVERMVRLSGDHAEAEQMIRIYLESMLISIKRREERGLGGNSDKTNILLPYVKMPGPGKMDPRFHQAVDFMLRHLNNNFTVAEFSEILHISRSHLQALFRAHVNCGIMHFFHQLKIDKAKEIIREKDLDFSEIAFFLGYRSLSTFSKKFKSMTGMSPKAYRESVKAYADKTAEEK